MRAVFDYTCGIDTMSLRSAQFLPYSPCYFTYDQARRIVGNPLDEQYEYRYNLSKQIDNAIHSFYNCVRALDLAMLETDLEKPTITRIDFCFDDFTNDYRDLYKLNHLLLYLLAKKMNIKNDYSSRGIISPVLKTLRIQNSKFEAEFYNKAIEEPNGIIKCRLELRCKRVSCRTGDTKAIADALRQWLEILKSVTQLKNRDLDVLLNDLNDEIIKHYDEDVKRYDYSKMDYNSMIQRYHRYIFTRRQLSELLRRMGYKSYDSVASKFKSSHRGLEFFKPYELREYINHIIGSAELFLAT